MVTCGHFSAFGMESSQAGWPAGRRPRYHHAGLTAAGRISRPVSDKLAAVSGTCHRYYLMTYRATVLHVPVYYVLCTCVLPILHRGAVPWVRTQENPSPASHWRPKTASPTLGRCNNTSTLQHPCRSFHRVGPIKEPDGFRPLPPENDLGKPEKCAGPRRPGTPGMDATCRDDPPGQDNATPSS